MTRQQQNNFSLSFNTQFLGAGIKNLPLSLRAFILDDFYLPEIEAKIKKSNTKSESDFKSGLLGEYFTKIMLPKERLNKMKTFKDKNPLNAKLDKSVIERFSNQQVELLDLLNKSRNVSLNKVKIATSVSSLIRLKLGDTFQFFINHILRHLKQIDRIQAEIKNA